MSICLGSERGVEVKVEGCNPPEFIFNFPKTGEKEKQNLFYFPFNITKGKNR